MRWDRFFLSRIKGNIIKWWQQVLLPALHINNDKQGKNRFSTNKQNENAYSGGTEDAMNSMFAGPGTMGVDNYDSYENANNAEKEDPLEVLNRIQQQKEQERQKDIERARQQAQEEARIASIMNANKVDVNAFIEAGKAAITDNSKGEQSNTTDEDMQKAQEIIDRLNREAAEDEAKKQAEIEAAKQKAEEIFG